MSTSPILIATLLAVLASSTSAQDAKAPTQDARTRRIEGLETMPYTPPAASTQGSQRAVDDHNCLRQTGSHIPPKKGKCIPAPGRVYDKQDLDRTGEQKLGPALRKLDPSVGGH
ncbi:hypothetical protein [Dyella sp. 2RAB6]|uniref:hypothetical protein n=1 Tax=Dyella sp. 2RAB6 TaxID=3232992 RepID=UPI003F8FD9C1